MISSNSSKWRYALVLALTLVAGIGVFSSATAYFKGYSRSGTPTPANTENKNSGTPSIQAQDLQTNTINATGNRTTEDLEPSSFGGRDLSSLSLNDLWALYGRPGALKQNERGVASKWISQRLAESKQGTGDVGKDMARRLLDEAVDARERDGLARILGESNTPEGLSALTDALFSTPSSLLQRSIIEQIGRMGAHQSPEQVRAMTEVALDAWQKVGQKPEIGSALYSILSGLLAKLGDPEGIAFLRSQALEGGATVTELDASNRDASLAAMNASLQVRGTESITFLSSALQKNEPGSTEFVWSGQALATMGRPEATAALIDWAKHAPDASAESAATWIGAVRDSRSHALVRELAASGAQMQFASDRVKQAVLTSAKKLATQ